MSGSSESKNPPPPSNETSGSGVTRRHFLRRALGWVAGTAGAVAGIGASKPAEAQGLFDPAPTPAEPPILNPQEKPASEAFAGKKSEVPAHIASKLEHKASLVSNLLKDPGEPSSISITYHNIDSGISSYAGAKNSERSKTIKNPVLTVSFSEKTALDEEQMMDDAGKQFAEMFLNSHPEQPIVSEFTESFFNLTGLDLNKVGQGRASADEMALWQSTVKTLDIQNMQEKKGYDKLPELVFKEIFSDLINHPEKIDDSLAKLPGKTQQAAAGIYLGVLHQMARNAKEGFPLNSLINPSDLEKVISYSKNSEYKKVFDKRSARVN